MKKIECACNFLMDKDAQGYIDLSDLDLTSCHFKGDVISKVSFLSSNLQHVTFECKEIGSDSNLLIVFYVQIMPDDFVMQLHRF